MADVIVRVVQFDSPAGTGNLDIGHADFGGATPKAVMIFGGRADASDTVPSDNADWMVGFAVNGGSQNVNESVVQDNQGTSANARRYTSTQVIRGAASSVATILATVSAWIPNGITLNFGTNTAGVRRFTAILFGGADVTAATGITNLTTAASPTIDVTAPGFQPDLVLIGTCFNPGTDNQNGGDALFGIGAATRVDGAQRSMFYGASSGNPAASAPCTSIFNTASIVRQTLNNTTQVFTGVVNAFDANGFSFAMTGATDSSRVAWLALKLDGVDVKLHDLVTPTATGQVSYTNPGFTPQAVLIGGTTQPTMNTSGFNAAANQSIGFGACDISGAMGAKATTDDPSADPTNTKELAAPHAYMLGNATVPNTVLADLVSMDDLTGFTLDWTAVSGSAHQGWALAIEVGEEPTPTIALERVSQHAMLVLAANFTVPRVSQHVMLVLGNAGPCITRRADIWRITRKDGVVLGFTGHDRPIVFGSVTYTPCNSLQPSASQQTADIESVSNIELMGIISDDAISERDILAGLYDDAFVEIFRVYWAAPDDDAVVVDSVRRMHAGWVSTISTGDKGYNMEVLGPGARLAQKTILDVVSPSCRFELGDEDCGVDIAALTLSGEVTTARDKGAFVADLASTTGGAQYDQGKVNWLTGENAGHVSKIKTVEFVGDLATIVLWTLAPFMPEPGDTIEVVPGCDKQAQTCKGVYDNYLEFGGYDMVPGNDEINKTPDAAY